MSKAEPLECLSRGLTRDGPHSDLVALNGSVSLLPLHLQPVLRQHRQLEAAWGFKMRGSVWSRNRKHGAHKHTQSLVSPPVSAEGIDRLTDRPVSKNKEPASCFCSISIISCRAMGTYFCISILQSSSLCSAGWRSAGSEVTSDSRCTAGDFFFLCLLQHGSTAEEEAAMERGARGGEEDRRRTLSSVVTATLQMCTLERACVCDCVYRM